MRHWREPRYWLWWWRYRASPEVQIVSGLVVVAMLATAGFAAAGRMPAGNEAGYYLETVTVEQIKTLPPRTIAGSTGERAARRTGPAAGAVLSTQVILTTVTTPGGTTVLRQRQVVPIIRRNEVTVTDALTRVVETRVDGTETRVVTRDRVVTQERVVTAERTVRDEVTTVRVETVPVTQTVRTTETVAVTDTVTMPVTVTEQVTVTVTTKRP